MRSKKSLINQVRGIWNEYNKIYFKGQLSEPTFRITRATKYYGDFCVTESSARPTLRISNRTNSNPQLLRDTVLHEMVHQFFWESGFPDWDAHGDSFKQFGRRIGIEV